MALQIILLHNSLIKRELKACVCIFDLFVKLQPLNNYKNSFCFIKKNIFLLEIFKCLWPCLSLFLFFPVNRWLRGWSKINLRVYDVSIFCLISWEGKNMTLNLVNWQGIKSRELLWKNQVAFITKAMLGEKERFYIPLANKFQGIEPVYILQIFGTNVKMLGKP